MFTGLFLPFTGCTNGFVYSVYTGLYCFILGLCRVDRRLMASIIYTCTPVPVQSVRSYVMYLRPYGLHPWNCALGLGFGFLQGVLCFARVWGLGSGSALCWGYIKEQFLSRHQEPISLTWFGLYGPMPGWNNGRNLLSNYPATEPGR